jgi:hypothetical protein
VIRQSIAVLMNHCTIKENNSIRNRKWTQINLEEHGRNWEGDMKHSRKALQSPWHFR